MIEQDICNTIHDFVKEHINEVKNSYDDLGFKDSEDMLSQIKSDIQIAIWALTELLDWGMSKNYMDSFIVDAYVYKVGEHYFKMESWSPEYKIVPVKKVTKIIEITEWEELNSEDELQQTIDTLYKQNYRV